jgi:hypothetical protein
VRLIRVLSVLVAAVAQEAIEEVAAVAQEAIEEAAAAALTLKP